MTEVFMAGMLMGYCGGAVAWLFVRLFRQSAICRCEDGSKL